MRVAFLGTPDFADTILRALIQSGSYELAVFTQPDKPVGRKAVLTPPPVKTTALENGLPVYQFTRISDPEGAAAIAAFAPDFLVTAAYGQKLSDEILALPRIEPVNVHASLLPRYRGASPIQSCILNGDTTTGVTVMRMVSRMDAGDVFSFIETEVQPDETADALSLRLADMGAKLLLDTLPLLTEGKLTPVSQDGNAATVCRKLTRETGHIDFMKPAYAVHNLVRGTYSWPGAYALLDGQPLKIHRTRILSADLTEILPGELFLSDEGHLCAACGEDAVELMEVQFAGGKRMDGASFLHGHAYAVGETLV